jgi:hypothetical protein
MFIDAAVINHQKVLHKDFNVDDIYKNPPQFIIDYRYLQIR